MQITAHSRNLKEGGLSLLFSLILLSLSLQSSIQLGWQWRLYVAGTLFRAAPCSLTKCNVLLPAARVALDEALSLAPAVITLTALFLLQRLRRRRPFVHVMFYVRSSI